MKIIALQGDDKTGKTATLRRVAKKLVDLFGCPDFSNPHFYNHIKKDKGEVWAVFILKESGKTIAITSHGDYPKILYDDLAAIRKEYSGKIDIFICANHDTPAMDKAVSNLSGGDFEIIKKSEIKVSGKSETEDNEQCAEYVFNVIKNTLNNQ